MNQCLDYVHKIPPPPPLWALFFYVVSHVPCPLAQMSLFCVSVGALIVFSCIFEYMSLPCLFSMHMYSDTVVRVFCKKC